MCLPPSVMKSLEVKGEVKNESYEIQLMYYFILTVKLAAVKI